MNPLAGHIILSGGLSLAVWSYLSATGSSAARWEHARTVLMARYPAAATVSINAVMRYAEQTVAIGNRQQRGGPEYRPPIGAIPNVMRVERYNEGTEGGGRPPEMGRRFYHEGIVEIYDPRWPNDPLHRLPITVVSTSLLSNQQATDAFNLQAQPWIDQFIQSGGGRFSELHTYTEIRFGGVYIGY